jgi:cell surface protein SprA
VALNSAVASSMTEEKSSKTTDTTGVRRLELDSREYSRQWAPLIGVDIGWKGGFDSNVRYNRDDQFREGSRTTGLSRTTNSSASATLSYSIRTGFRLPLLWLKAIRLENQTTFSMNFEYSTRKTETAGDNGIYAPREQTTSWSLQPQMTYSFSNTVQGQAHVMMQQTKDDITTNKTRLFEFGIQVQIAIRG